MTLFEFYIILTNTFTAIIIFALYTSIQNDR